MTSLTASDAAKRHISRDDYVTCELAFIDCKKPGSYPKGNYSIIGPGVTTSSKQVINLPEPHGFNIGAASMPNGITNNLHLHFTAEVFMVYAGDWTFRWGNKGENEITAHAGDIVTVPTWIFRGFTNTGPDDGWLFTTLGGDNTGGIIWHPSILEQAASVGLYLTNDGVLVDTEEGEEKPAEGDLLQPIAQEDMDKLRNFTPEEMRRRVIAQSDLAWRDDALLDSCLDGHASAMAPVIGHGMAQGGGMVAPVRFPHGFSQEWLRLRPGQSVSRHRIAEKQVMIPYKGTAEIVLNEAGDVSRSVGTRDTFSCPGGVWREIRNAGDDVLEVLLITPGEHRKRIEWPEATLVAAGEAGRGIDADGYVAPAHLIPVYKFA